MLINIYNKQINNVIIIIIIIIIIMVINTIVIKFMTFHLKFFYKFQYTLFNKFIFIIIFFN